MNEVHDEPLVPVFRASGESEAGIVRSLLESEGIPVANRSHHTHAVCDGIFTSGDGYYCDLMVTKDRAEEAKQVIAAYDVRGQTPEAGGDDPAV